MTLRYPELTGTQPLAMRGLCMLRDVALPAGTVIYRFADASRAGGSLTAIDSEWWLEYESFQAIRMFAEEHGHTLSYAARLFLAILDEWSAVNAVVSARLLKPLPCWKGRGKQVVSASSNPGGGERMTPMQSVREVYQLCIPPAAREGRLAMHEFRLIPGAATR